MRDVFKKMYAIPHLPRVVVMLFDLMVTVLAVWISYAILVAMNPYAMVNTSLWSLMLLVVLVSYGYFLLFSTHSGILRYVTLVDILKIFAAVLCSVITCYIADTIYINVTGMQSYFGIGLMIFFFVQIAALLGSRLSIRLFFDALQIRYASNKKGKVMIYGIGSESIAIASFVQSIVGPGFRLAGFINPQGEDHKKRILGVPIYPERANLAPFLRMHRVHAVIVPENLLSLNEKRDLVERLLDGQIKVLSAPPIQEIDEIGAKSLQLKDIQIEDLLGRDVIRIDDDAIRQEISGARVLITGAAGSIGSEIVRQLSHYSPALIVLCDQAETPMHDMYLEMQDRYAHVNFALFMGNVRNIDRMRELYETFHPEYVYHAAAYKHVPMMENHPTEAIQTNVKGTQNMADLAIEYGVKKFVMVSTDKAVNPTNVMGASKRIAEIYVQSLAKRLKAQGGSGPAFITTRFGNVLGSNGSVIPRFKAQIAQGGPVTVTHPDIIRYFMTIPEACRLVLHAGSMGQGGEIYVFDMGQPVKIVDLARKMIQLAGFIPDEQIKIVYTGLRPGEKLYEELLSNLEITKPTVHEKIMIAQVREYEFAEVQKEIQELLAIAGTGKNFLTVKQMKRIVPEFLSKNSIYEQIDLEAVGIRPPLNAE